MSQPNAFERLLDAFRHQGLAVDERGGRANCQAPDHSERDRSVVVTRIDGTVLVHSHSDDTDEVLVKLGYPKGRRDPGLYDEPNGVGRVGRLTAHRIYQYPDGRLVGRTADKRFGQGGTRNPENAALYRSDQIGNSEIVYFTEGEKDADAVVAIGGTAVCNAQGAGKIHLSDLSPLAGKTVLVIRDQDKNNAGQSHAAQVAAALDGIAAEVAVVDPVVGKDAADHIAAGHDLAELVPVDTAPRRARITWADQIEPEPVVWAWQEGDAGRIPAGSFSVAAGREGTGKSSFGIWLAAQITRGTLPGSYEGRPRRVFYVAVEDSWKYTLVPRLIAAGADLSKIGRFEVVSDGDDELSLALPHDNALLERSVSTNDVALVVIDPLMSVIGERIDTHREREVRSALDPLAKIADRTEAVVLGIAHFNKGGGTDAASLITGSGAFKNVPRSVFGFVRDESSENGGRVMTQVKNSLGRDDLPSLGYVIETAEIPTRKGTTTTGRFTFTGESERSVADVLRDARGQEDHDDRREIDTWLIDYIASEGGSADAREALRDGRAAGYTADMIKKARKRIGATHKQEGFGKGARRIWSLGDSPTGAITGATGASDENPAPVAPVAAPVKIDPPEPTLVRTPNRRPGQWLGSGEPVGGDAA